MRAAALLLCLALLPGLLPVVGVATTPAAGWGSAHAQQSELRIDIEQGFAGLDGYIRPGTWTPIRLSVDNLAADDRDVTFSWEITDQDGDRVIAQRRATLTRQREDQPVWLYAPVPITTRDDARWTLRAIDSATGRQLANLTLQPQGDLLLRNSETLIAVTSAADLGLNDVGQYTTMHAPVRLVRGLSLSRLPDRWQGLDGLNALVWTQDLGDDPANPLRVPEAALTALRQWVARGGHLVVVLPQVGQTWTQSPLADILPVDGRQLRPVDTADWWEIEGMGGMLQIADAPGPSGAAGGAGAASGGDRTMTVTTFDVADNDPRATVLLRDGKDRPVVVAGRYGFGAVTLVGLDLTADVVRRYGAMVGERRLWHHVFGWNWPLLTPTKVKSEETAGRLRSAEVIAKQNQVVELGRFIPGQVAMTGTVATLLIGAVLLFGLYWLTAGWLIQPVLKRRGRERWSWVVFVGMVTLFAGLAWSGAALLRPGRTGLAHVTILDFDGNAQVARGRAFVSLFVPRFGTTRIRVGDAEDQASVPGDAAGVSSGDLISAPGFSADREGRGFLDTQQYVLSAVDPDSVDLPMRSTSKRLMVDFLGSVAGDQPGLAAPFSIAATTPLKRGDDGWPVGAVTHTLPGTLTNVQVIYCPGEQLTATNQRRQLRPQVWRYVDANGRNAWAPGEPLTLAGRPTDPVELTPQFRSWSRLSDQRDWKREEGLLGRRLEETQVSADAAAGGGRVDESVIARQLELLSFFDAVPMADLKQNPDQPAMITAKVLHRTLGPRLDLTPLLRGRRVIILGHLKAGPLPLPLSVDGETPPARGWTFVRWIYDF